MNHHHHTDTALVFHCEQDADWMSGLTHLELGMPCEDEDCPSLTPKKLVRPGYNVAIRVGK